MILDPHRVQDLYEQFRNETRCYWAREDDIAVNLAAANKKLHAWLSARQGYEKNPWIATIRTFRIYDDKTAERAAYLQALLGYADTAEHLIIPYHLFRFLCEHLKCFAWDAWWPIEINYAAGTGFDIGLGTHGNLLNLKCCSWETQCIHEQIVRKIDEIRLPEHQSFIMRKSLIQNLRAILGEQKIPKKAAFFHSRSLLMLGECSPYFLASVGSDKRFASSFRFDFPPYYRWFDCGAVKFTVSTEKVLLETLDETFFAISPLKSLPADPLVSLNLDSEPIGTWIVTSPDALLRIPGDWEYVTLLLSEEQTLIQATGKVGADVTTCGYYRGTLCRLRLITDQILNLIQKGFRRFEIRRDRDSLCLMGHLPIRDDDGRLFEGEKRKRHEEIIALVYTLRGPADQLRIFPKQIDGTVQ